MEVLYMKNETLNIIRGVSSITTAIITIGYFVWLKKTTKEQFKALEQ